MPNVETLAEELEKAADAYYNTGQTEMSDAEFDRKRNILKTACPTHPFLAKVGSRPSGGHLAIAKHKIPMGSLSNANDATEYRKWAAHGLAVVATPKLDGSSIEIIYKDGVLVQAITRGDGFEGEDVTKNVSKFKNVLTTLKTKFSGSIRGEALLLKDDFIKHMSEHANPRNAANGTVRRKSGKNAQHLTFIAFDLQNGITFKTYIEKLNFIEKMGLETAKGGVYGNIDDVIAAHKKWAEERDDLPYEIDGMVLRINDEANFKSMGERDNRPKGAVAFKFKAMETTTTLLRIELSIGHTGAIIPVGKLGMVPLGGVHVSSVLLNNFDHIAELGIAIGDEVKVERAGDVIPKVTGVAQKAKNRIPIVAPTKCHCCGSALVKDGAHIFCRADDCSGKEESLLKSWIRKRNIKFIGDSLRVHLYENAGVDRPHKLYLLTEAGLSAMPSGNGVVGSNAKRIMEQLEKSKTASLADFVGSLGIKFLGRRQAKHMVDAGINTLQKFQNITASSLTGYEGFSATKATAVVDGLKKRADEIAKLQEVGVKVINPSDEKKEAPVATGKFDLGRASYCFTGKIERCDGDGNRYKRTALQDLVLAANGVVHSTVKTDTDFLVVADPNTTSSKAKKARSNGHTKIIGENEFFGSVGV